MVEIGSVCRAASGKRPARPGRKLAAVRSRSILFAALSRLLLTFAAAIALALDDGDVGVVGERGSGGFMTRQEHHCQRGWRNSFTFLPLGFS